MGTVGTLEKHVATCGFALVPCPKQCRGADGDVIHFIRKDLDKHLKNDCPNRNYTCQSKWARIPTSQRYMIKLAK